MLDLLLARYPREAQPASAIEPLGALGGLSGAELWRFRSPRGLLVLRAWPPHGPGRDHIAQVHLWLAQTASLGFVPAPLADRAGRTIVEYDGRLWELAPWMEGAPDRAQPPGAARLEAAFAGLAAFHARLAGAECTGVSPGLRQRHLTLAQLIDGGFDQLEAAVTRGGAAADPDRTTALSWLTLARRIAPSWLSPLELWARQVIRLQPCLRDARPEHFLFEGDRLSGLVDFGAMRVDTVSGDLARLLGEWLDGDSKARLRALAAYERVQPLAPLEQSAIEPFESATAVLIGERWVRWHFLEGRRFENPQAVSWGLARGLEALESLARKATP
jgi:Ser/Thr protein kinase RdoA (MazF antagonist)